MEINTNDIITGIIIFAAIVGLIVMVSRAIKANVDLGIAFNKHFVEQEIFWLVMSVFLLMIGESALVSNFHPEGIKNYIPMPVRFIGHFSINFIGYLTTINAPKKGVVFFSFITPLMAKKDKRIQHLSELKLKGVTLWTIVMTGIYFFTSLCISMTMPVINLIILSTGVDQYEQLVLWANNTFSWLPFLQHIDYTRVPTELLVYTQTLNGYTGDYLPKNYSPFLDMVYPLKLVMIMVGVHYPLAFMKGLLTVMKDQGKLFNIMTGTSAASSGSSGTPKPTGGTPPPATGTPPAGPGLPKEYKGLTPLEKILYFWGYEDATKRDSKTTSINTRIGTLSTAIQTQLANKMYDFVKGIESFYSDPEKDQAVLNSKADALQEDIKSFFAGSSATGAGIGMPLSEGDRKKYK